MSRLDSFFFPGSFDLKIRSFDDGWIFSLGG